MGWRVRVCLGSLKETLGLLGLAGGTAGFRPDSASRAGRRPRAMERLGVTHAATGCASSTAGAARAHWAGERGPGSRDLYAIIEAFLHFGKKTFLSRGGITKQIVPDSLQRPGRLGHSILLQEAKNTGRLVYSPCFSVSRCLWHLDRGASEPPVWLPVGRRLLLSLFSFLRLFFPVDHF